VSRSAPAGHREHAPVCGEQPFFALNGDICTDLDLSAMRAFHEERGAAITIALHHVDDARAFGLVETDGDGRVRAFREKPEDLIPGDVNAGTYLIDPAVLASWTADLEILIEREIFPTVTDAGHPVFGFVSDAYWMDLGTPEKYLQAHYDLSRRRRRRTYEAPRIAPTAEVELGASLGARAHRRRSADRRWRRRRGQRRPRRGAVGRRRRARVDLGPGAGRGTANVTGAVGRAPPSRRPHDRGPRVPTDGTAVAP
jgi:hypothetical protein